MKLNLLSADLFFAGDAFGTPDSMEGVLWTADLLGDGFFKAEYRSGIINKETGEVSGGFWVETGGPSHEDYMAAAVSQRSQLLAEATQVIAPLQDAVDFGVATDEVKARLVSWKTYRIDLANIDVALAPKLAWPVKPE